MTTINPPRLGHIARAVGDPQRTAEFYRDLLDLPVVREGGNGLTGNAVFLSGHPHDEDHELVFLSNPEASHTAFRVDGIETLRAVYSRARATGVAVPYALDNGIARGFFVRDPEGNAVEIYFASGEPLRDTPPLSDANGIDRLILSR
jgi:catechol-2,3-dioxygenase